MSSNEEELQERYEAWVDAVLEGGAAYIIGNEEHNRVFEDPDEDRDLNLMFSSRRDAQARADPGDVIDPIAVDDLVTILENADGRGEGLALWHGESWIVADPAPLAEELRERI